MVCNFTVFSLSGGLTARPVTLDNVAKGLENDNMATEAACYVSLIVKMLDMLRDRLEVSVSEFSCCRL